MLSLLLAQCVCAREKISFLPNLEGKHEDSEGRKEEKKGTQLRCISFAILLKMGGGGGGKNQKWKKGSLRPGPMHEVWLGLPGWSPTSGKRMSGTSREIKEKSTKTSCPRLDLQVPDILFPDDGDRPGVSRFGLRLNLMSWLCQFSESLAFAFLPLESLAWSFRMRRISVWALESLSGESPNSGFSCLRNLCLRNFCLWNLYF